MIDRAGQFLGNYRLVRPLGRGGFAQVYLGEHVRLETQVAIKLLSTRLADEDIQQFLAEARMIARLEHPHIIRILDFDIEQDTPFLIMSYAPNGTLRQRYSKGTRLPLDRVLTYLKQVAGALQYAHDAKMIHRDIKPENLLLGKQDEVLLSDFGIAVVAHSSRSQSTQEIIGTVPYMAPEQIQGRPRPASDQYALGVTVYEWLCGYPPFRGTTAEVAMQHLHADLPSLREQSPAIPPAVEAVVLRALEKDPHRRFASVQGLALAFEAACQSSLPETVTLSLQPATEPHISSQGSEQIPFHAAPTLVEKEPAPVPRGRWSVSRRALLFGTLSLVGLVEAGGALAAVALSRRPPLPLSPGSILVTYTGHQGPVMTVAWSPDGARIASGSQDQTVQVWDATSGALALNYHGHTTNINTVAWSPTQRDQRLASAGGNDFFQGDDVVQVWDAATGTDILAYKNYTQPVRSVAWSPNGALIASGGEDRMVQVWSATNRSPQLPYRQHKAAVNAVAWSPDGARIASASDDTTAQIWDVQSATRISSLNHKNTVNAVAWSPDGKRVASACGSAFFGGEHNVQIWDATTGAHILTYEGHAAPVNAVAWSPDGKRIASASASFDKTVHVWDATGGTAIFTCRGHTLGVNAVAWSPDGRRLASASNDGTVRVWKIL